MVFPRVGVSPAVRSAVTTAGVELVRPLSPADFLRGPARAPFDTLEARTQSP
ncbi:hypothetical protein [Leifsonia sp. LS1]|uniref:hypothetical protein n=1 Tax=Leifsonia sp. LS1 TaxID=2828483 RepID=UPI001CFD8DE9|nr:hypothetical protein [Leifsonia sp. LS1]